MTWNVIAKVGPSDSYDVLPSADHRNVTLRLEDDQHPHIEEYPPGPAKGRVALPLATMAADLLNVALTVHAADMRISRRGTPDGWTRSIILHLPVSDVAGWTKAGDVLIRLLTYLTGDRWELRLRQRAPGGFRTTIRLRRGREPDPRVTLFSGGLDSYVGAATLLRQDGDLSTVLVSHYGDGSTSQAQVGAYEELLKWYSGRVRLLRLNFQPSMSLSGSKEPTTRSRSFLFLAMGVAVSTGLNTTSPLWVPENGLISLNVPLTNARSGSLSTRTTHPHTLLLFQTLVNALKLECQLENPYRFLTKGEMLATLIDCSVLTDGFSQTMSCAHPTVSHWTRGEPYAQHCGYCVPCIIRRAALNAVGLSDPKYGKDILTDPPSSRTKRGLDLRAFSMAVERFRETPRHRKALQVMGSGPLPTTSEELAQYVAVFERSLEEVARFLVSGRTL